MTRRRYADHQFRDAVADPTVRTIADLCRALGIVPRGGNYEVVRRTAERLGVRLPRRQPRTPSPIDDAALRAAVAGSHSMAAVLRQLGLPQGGGTRERVQRAIDRLGLDTSHHTGQAWNRGRRYPERRLRPEQLNDGRLRGGERVRRVLIGHGLKEHRCEACLETSWRGEPIPLELDHVDGDRRNNALENLRLLCPNCHAHTPTYRGRNIGRHTSFG